jgi:mRNA-degrading endonuclease RelE of RelBE toxin-antitoxin system
MKNLIWSDNFTRKLKKLLRQNPQLRFLIEKKLEEIAENPNRRLSSNCAKSAVKD